MINKNNNKVLISIIVFLLIVVWVWAFHIANKDKIIEGNMIHNMMIWWKMEMWDSDDDVIKEHCEMMPNMKGCEKYNDIDKKNTEDNVRDMIWMMNWNSGENYDYKWNLADLPEAKKSEIVELKDWDTYEMTASIVKQEVWNRTVKRLAYNWMIPGPLLKVKKGSKINIKLTNNLDVETTLHSHWLRLDDSKFDWLPTTMWGQQKPIKPWESFVYKLNFPDTGVFWYHPHIREDYTQEMGLYWNFAVTEDKYWNTADKEEYLILDDFSEDDIFYKNKVNKTLMGRFGNIMMINNDENYELTVNQYDVNRLFITNVANTRTFDFWIYKDWVKQKLKLVGWDIWRIEKETMINSQIIAPAERYIVETRFDIPWEYLIKSKDRVLGKIIVKKSDIVVKQKAFWSDLRENLDDYKNIRDNLDEFLSKAPDKKLRLTIGMKWQWEMRMWMDHKDWMWNMMWGNEDDMVKKEESLWWKLEHNESDGIEWEDDMARMNNMSNSNMMNWILEDEDTKKQNMDINWKFKKWDFVKVEIFNDPKSMHPMQHPIHFHGQRFIVLTRDWKVQDNMQWKDTTLVKKWEKIEILIEMTNVWLWMSHCHIAEHLQSGMMMTFRVEEK